MKCPGCNYVTENYKEFEEHLKESHFLLYKTYSEIELLSKKSDEFFCYRCKSYRSPLTFLIPEFYYLPCQNCFSLINRKTERQSIIQTIIRNIKDFYDRLLGDRYLQLFISDDKFFNSTLPHNYINFKNILSHLELPSRNDIWLIDWNLGFPKIITKENINGLKIINLSSSYNIISTKTQLIINNYEIKLPEFIPYDVSHHCRYSILNKTSNRKTKRIRLPDTDNCIKFYNSKNNFKSIFKIIDLDTGNEIETKQINPRDYFVIKLSLLRNKSYVRYIFDIIYEFLKVSNKFRDGIFLKNTITIDPDRDISLNLSWSSEDYLSNYINISIL